MLINNTPGLLGQGLRSGSLPHGKEPSWADPEVTSPQKNVHRCTTVIHFFQASQCSQVLSGWVQHCMQCIQSNVLGDWLETSFAVYAAPKPSLTGQHVGNLCYSWVHKCCRSLLRAIELAAGCRTQMMHFVQPQNPYCLQLHCPCAALECVCWFAAVRPPNLQAGCSTAAFATGCSTAAFAAGCSTALLQPNGSCSAC